ncbi:MAG: DUF4262 domain-containing protein [Novosphingobium sp.]|nr:DUF4262 domain-containing protein [Novosphingobium sp.]
MLGWFKKGGVTDYEREIIANVEKHGCHVNWVFDEQDGDPAFAYSIGFTKTVGGPEVILFGLPQETCGQAINYLLVLRAGGLALVEGARISGIFGDYDCIVRMVHESWLIQSYFASALWYHRTQMEQPLTEVAMLVWPDADHVFPWEEGCADWVRADQPELYLPRLAA